VLESGNKFIYCLEISSTFYFKFFDGATDQLPALASDIPAGVIEAARDGRATIILCDAQEIRPHAFRIYNSQGEFCFFFDIVQMMLIEHGIPPRAFWFLDSNFFLEKEHREWLQTRGLDPTQAFVWRAALLFDASTARTLRLERAGHVLRLHEDERNGILTVSIQSSLKAHGMTATAIDRLEAEFATDEARPKSFLCLNNVPRNHRQALVFYIIGRGLARHGMISLHVDPAVSGVNPALIADPETYKYIQRGIELTRGKLPIRLDLNMEPRLQTGMAAGSDVSPDQWSTFGLGGETLYRSSYVSFVTETYFRSDCLSLSEKLFKPIARLQPFVSIGMPGALRILRERGYRTFGRIIDESYDDIVDDRQRFAAILKVVDGIGSLNPAECRDLYVALLDETIHNYRHLQESSTEFDRIMEEIYF
jgi:hypothetical protein